jgi:uncharacterized membrane protein YfcA
VRTRYARLAVAEVVFAVVLLVVGVTNAISGFLGHGWFLSVVPLALAVVSLRSASVLWNVRDRVAAGQDRLAAMDEPTRRARKRRAYRIVSLQFVVMMVVMITGASVGGWLGLLVALLAQLGALELLSLALRLRRRRRAA